MVTPVFFDLAGNKRAIPELALTDRDKFREVRDRLLAFLSFQPPDPDLSKLWEESPEFQELVLEGLSYFQIRPEWISVSMMGELLISCGGDAPGVLWLLEFGG